MNPYQINPRLIQTVDQANVMLNRFDAEISLIISNQLQSEESLNATIDVLSQTHPDLKADLENLAYSARVVGNIEGNRNNAALMKSEFRSALPYAIKQQLQS